MSGFFSQIVFLQPMILAALLGLPLLWYLLRITPPPAQKIFFPAARLLVGLTSDENTPSRTPWWILLLRMLIAALVIIALAQPVKNMAQGIEGSGAVRLVIDNSWAGAQNWQQQMDMAEELATQAEREGRDVYVLTTTPRIGLDDPDYIGAVTGKDALSFLRGLSPQPVPADYAAAARLVRERPSGTAIYSVWLSHGLDEGGKMGNLARVLQNQGALKVVLPAPEHMPLLLRPAKVNLGKDKGDNGVSVMVDAPSNIPPSLPVSVQVNGENGSVIDIQSASLSPGNLPQRVGFDLVEQLKSTITGFKVNARSGAGAVLLLDERYHHRHVGIVASAEDMEAAPLAEASYYLKRALEPYADITLGSIPELLDKNVSMMILPDVAAMPSDTLNRLEQWVKNGGLLLRFSGPNTAKTKDPFLMPVSLRSGGRSLSGALTWEEPQKIEPFKEDSPFYGLDVADDITVTQQVLADPAQDLEGKVWAQLKDGTPLITAAPLDRGLIVLVHTTASPEWSNLALSGLYVNILKRLQAMAKGSSVEVPEKQNSLDPVVVMDGNGRLIPPPPGVQPLPASGAEKAVPDSRHPPGIYGHGGFQYALNLGNALPRLRDVGSLPLGVERGAYDSDYEVDLMPPLLLGALVLLMLDWVVMIALGGGFRMAGLRKAVMVLAVAGGLVMPTQVFAKDLDPVKYTQGLYLAYIKTGDSALDSVFQSGLEQLSKALARRTSVEPAGVVGLDPEEDTLAFFPLIYWGVSPEQSKISGKAIQNIQYYLDHGGTILFDTRDDSMHAAGRNDDTINAQTLRHITAFLNVPPLIPVPKDHVLGRSFYLLDKFPGRYEDGQIWVEQNSTGGRDGVSSVLIGSNDWASAWDAYGDHSGYSSRRQNEMAMRFGINLVMYALTGNYKADQVHIPYILERLGE